MAKVIELYLDEQGIERMRNLSSDLGYVAFNNAVMLAPYDTGNLRRSISLVRNSDRKITIRYNTFVANYLYFLENGIGRVKKHTGFISVKTKNAIVESIVNYAEIGFLPPFSFNPSVELKSTSNLFQKEKTILRSVNSKSNRISADVRKQISMIREREYAKLNNLKEERTSRISGVRVETTNRSRISDLKANSSLSALQRAYKSMKE